jgi:hypothetical protein
MKETRGMRVRMKVLTTVLVLGVVMVTGCSTADDPASSTSSSAPSSHTLSKKGVMHMTGLTSPVSNCASCHGSDLRGGTAGVSCYSCHNQLW